MIETLSPSLFATLARAALGTFDLTGFQIDAAPARDALEDQLRAHLSGINSPAAKQKRLRRFSVPHTTPEDYTERLIGLGDEGHVLAGIRHMGLDPDQPFIALWPGFALRDPAHARAIAARIAPHFAVFSPLAAQFWAPEPLEVDQIHSVYMLQHAQRIAALPPWPGEARIELEVPGTDAYYPWYARGYDEFHALNPELRGRVPRNDRERLEESRRAGLLCQVLIDGDPVGLIAADESPFLGRSGVYFQEIFLTRAWRGRGLARAIQRAFVHHHCGAVEFAWGTIDSDNRPSFRTAAANTRRPVRFECIVDLAATPDTA